MFSLPEGLDAHLRGGGTLVVPGRQRARAVRLARAAERLAAGERVWRSAAVFTAAGWLRRQVMQQIAQAPARWPRLLSAAEEWYLWRECAADVAPEAVLLDRAGLARGLQRAHERALHYRIPVHSASAGSEAALLFEARRAFERRCHDLNAADVASLATRLARQGIPAAAAPLRLAGFASVSPLLGEVCGVGAEPVILPPPQAVDHGPPGIMRPADNQDELEQIGIWCRERIASQPHARLLVLLPASAGWRERLVSLIGQAIDPAGAATLSPEAPCAVMEDGVPLLQVPVLRHAIDTLSWLAGSAMEYEDFGDWLRAPFWAHPSAADRARIDLLLRQRGALSVRLRDLPVLLAGSGQPDDAVARPWGLQLTRAALALPHTAASAQTWSERFQAALKQAGWPGPQAQRTQQPALQRWHELLEEFGGLAPCCGSLDRGRALGVLRELAGGGVLQGADVDAAVTVGATLCDPVVRYDGIWVGGLTAESFPAGAHPDPYLTLRAQQAAGLPESSTALQRAQAAGLLQCWRAGSRELLLSAPRRSGDLPLAPSPLLAETGQPVDAPPGDVWLPGRLHRDGLTGTFLDETGTAWASARPLPRGTRTLDLQNTCPFRAYAELRLGCTQPEEPQPGIDSRQRGIFIHAALERLWGELRGSAGLAACSPEVLTVLIERCVAEAARLHLVSGAHTSSHRRQGGQFDLFAADTPATARECRRAARLIGAICELERQRAPFEVQGRERELELSLAGATLNMRADRIDRLDDGGLVVLDYKTGQGRSPDWLSPRPKYPQLLAYAVALGEQVAALAVVSINSRKAGFNGTARTAGLLPQVEAAPPAPEGAAAGWLHSQRQWRETVAALIRDFLAGGAAVDPVDTEVCQWCHIQPLCRIAELRQDGA
ncbi:MAG: PD-(D/E)XK nuclease family protein [Proteobacteria bacterium]|nr:PD-(D/E)XK nuclease family protein [Pseudomonadota bacterium]